MNGRSLALAAGLALGLGGCVTMDGSYGGGYGYDPSPSYGYGWGPPTGYGYGGGVPMGYGYGSPYGGRRGFDDYERRRASVSTLGKRSTPALMEGCKDRYGLYNHKYQQCIRGERHSGEALAAGCKDLFKGDPKNYRRCRQGS